MCCTTLLKIVKIVFTISEHLVSFATFKKYFNSFKIFCVNYSCNT